MKVLAEGNEHRDKTLKGIRLVSRLVGSTLGPSGRNVILDRGFSVPIISNDGISVARAIESTDDIERMGIELIKDPALKTNEQAGDGTTTTIVFTHALIEEGLKYSDNPMDIKRSLTEAGYAAVEALQKMSRPVKGDEILKVATISAESEEIGQIITDTIQAIGKDGVISVEESKLPEIESKIVEGYEVERGYVSAFMANKGSKAEYKNTAVLVLGDKLSTITEILPLLQKISLKIKELVIFCTEIDPAVINTFAVNQQNAIFNTLVVKCASQKNEVLEDVAFVTGATFVSKEAGYTLEELDEKILGKAERIVATGTKTIILNGGGTVKGKIKELKAQLPKITDDNEYDMVEKRIARLQGGVAVISVGAKTEQDMRYLYYKIEDAVNATKSAVEEGIVEGGGMALYRLSTKLPNKTVGEKILNAALRAPLKKIIENGLGKDYTEIVKGLDAKPVRMFSGFGKKGVLYPPKNAGYDAKRDKYVNMFEAGIIDPTKVERCVIENGISCAALYLTSNATVALVRNDLPSKLE